MSNLAWAVGAYMDGRDADYERYDDYYRGHQPLQFATPKFESAFGKTFEAFAYNRCANVIEAFVDRLRIEGFDADDDEIALEAQKLWDAALMPVNEDRVYREVFISGDAYVIVERDPITGRINFWPQDAQNVRVLYDPNVPGKIVAAVKRWPLTDGRIRLNLYLPGYVYKFVSQHASQISRNAVTAQTVPSSVIGTGTYERWTNDREPWPLPLGVPDEVPVFHFANNAPINQYGRSELADVVPLQDALNKTLMDLLVAMEFAAFPQRILVDIKPDKGTEEALKRFAAGVNQILALYYDPNAPGAENHKTPGIHEFSAANITQYTQIVELFDQLISRTAKIPVHYLTLPSQPPSGESLKVAEAPFSAKIESKQRAFGAVWNQAITYALRLAGREVALGDVEVVYASAQPIAIEERLANAKTKRELGMPLESVLREEGRDPDELRQIKAELEAEAAGTFAVADDQEVS